MIMVSRGHGHRLPTVGGSPRCACGLVTRVVGRGALLVLRWASLSPRHVRTLENFRFRTYTLTVVAASVTDQGSWPP